MLCTAPPPQYSSPSRPHPVAAAGSPLPDREKVLPAIRYVLARAPSETAKDISLAPDLIPSPRGTSCWHMQTESYTWCALLRPPRSSIPARPVQLQQRGLADRS